MRIIASILIVLSIIFLYLLLSLSSHQLKFIDQICIIPFKDYDYKTCSSMRAIIDGKTYVIPKDFESDLASIPRIMWPIFAPQYVGFVSPAILHDYLYRCNDDINRKIADEVLYSALIENDVSKLTAFWFYIGVRLFGISHFNHGIC